MVVSVKKFNRVILWETTICFQEFFFFPQDLQSDHTKSHQGGCLILHKKMSYSKLYVLNKYFIMSLGGMAGYELRPLALERLGRV